MKKRLRKKLSLREFQQLGFYVRFAVDVATVHDADVFWDKLVNFMEVQGLLMSGNAISFYVTRPQRGTATEANRAAVDTWLRQQPEVSAIQVWPLEDVWYGSFLWFYQAAGYSK